MRKKFRLTKKDFIFFTVSKKTEKLIMKWKKKVDSQPIVAVELKVELLDVFFQESDLNNYPVIFTSVHVTSIGFYFEILLDGIGESYVTFEYTTF